MPWISSRSASVTRSSASSESIQSPWHWPSAKFFWLPYPSQARKSTRSVNSRAIATVLSLEPASTTTISSAHTTLSRHARSRSSSFRTTIATDRLATVSVALAQETLRRLEDGLDGNPIHPSRRALDGDDAGAVRSVPLSARRPVETDRRHCEYGGDVHRAGVPANHEGGAPEERDHLGDARGRGYEGARPHPVRD